MGKLIKTNIVLFMVLSMIFIMPFQLGSVFAETAYQEGPDVEDRTNTGGGSAFTTRQQASNLCTGGDTNVKDSLVLSIVTLCLPGILEKGMEWRENKCFAAKCYYNAVSNGLDPSFCVAQDDYRTCKYIVGELFALPPMAILEYFKQMITNILANPVGILWSAATKVSRLTVYGSCGPASTGIMCQAAMNMPYGLATGILVVTDAISIVNIIMDIFENGIFSTFDGEEDMCEGIDDIREEMEQILGIYEAEAEE